MFARACRTIIPAVGLVFLTGCAGFAVKYQNYFTKNFAYFASKYDGNPNNNLSAGAESNNFEDGNESSYSAKEFPSIITGFRTLEYQNTNYHKGNQFDIEFMAVMVTPGKTDADAIPVASFALKGKNFSFTKQLPESSHIVLINMSYPAPMIYLDNKALQAKYGTGAYTVIWKVAREDGKESNREMTRVTTNLVP